MSEVYFEIPGQARDDTGKILMRTIILKLWANSPSHFEVIEFDDKNKIPLNIHIPINLREE
jgi:hypothetical protein